MCDWRLSHLRRLILVTYASSQWRGKQFLIEHVVNVKTLNGSEHDGRSFKRWYGFYAFTGGRERTFHFFLLKLKILEAKVKFWCGTHLIFFKILEESEQFFILFLKKMENLRRFFSIFEVRGGKYFLERGVTQIWSLFFIAKLIVLSCLNKTNCLVNSKAKELFMCFYVICMNKHVGITLSVFLLVLYTGARGTDHPLFLTFCLQTYFQ